MRVADAFESAGNISAVVRDRWSQYKSTVSRYPQIYCRKLHFRTSKDWCVSNVILPSRILSWLSLKTVHGIGNRALGTSVVFDVMSPKIHQGIRKDFQPHKLLSFPLHLQSDPVGTARKVIDKGFRRNHQYVCLCGTVLRLIFTWNYMTLPNVNLSFNMARGSGSTVDDFPIFKISKSEPVCQDETLTSSFSYIFQGSDWSESILNLLSCVEVQEPGATRCQPTSLGFYEQSLTNENLSEKIRNEECHWQVQHCWTKFMPSSSRWWEVLDMVSRFDFPTLQFRQCYFAATWVRGIRSESSWRPRANMPRI